MCFTGFLLTLYPYTAERRDVLGNIVFFFVVTTTQTPNPCGDHKLVSGSLTIQKQKIEVENCYIIHKDNANI